MEIIDIYDVASDTWYQQSTKNGPGTRTRGCAVVTYASDLSSFNIYYYGGFDGVHVEEAFNDDVWVLSLPSFTWTEINHGTTAHARAGHKCFMPYPDQMMAFAGYTSMSGSSLDCLDQGALVIFNVTSGDWMDSYDPSKYGDYGVPQKLQSVIGGSASGGATLTQPPTGWATSVLGDIFTKTYDMNNIKTFWPYATASSSASRPTQPASNREHGKGLPNWVLPFSGIIVSLIVIGGMVVPFCLRRRRRRSLEKLETPSTGNGPRGVWSGTKDQQSSKAPTPLAFKDKIRQFQALPTGWKNPPGVADTLLAGQLKQAHEMADTAVIELEGIQSSRSKVLP